MEERKKDHIELAFQSQILRSDIDHRFYYEPMLSAHPKKAMPAVDFGKQKQMAPLWVSSMTGGTKLAGGINRNLARVCREFGFGMGLGSCRIIMDDDTYFPDFDMRDEIGLDMPFFANLGIAQIEELIRKGEMRKVDELISRLRADGLIIHVNPMQEWFQPEGDKLNVAPIETVKKFLGHVTYPIIVKEVGQGMGMESLKALLELPLLAIEFAAFGGTNFAKLELARRKDSQKQLFEPLSHIGHDAYEMTEMANQIFESGNVKTRHLIISGGIKSFLDGYYLISKSKIPAIYGQASGFLKYASESYEELKEYVEYQIKGLDLSYNYLRVKQ
jgi:isopentenyl-diphosphate delta-isomerase